MEWSEVTVKVPAAKVDDAAAITQMVVPYGIYIEDYSDLVTEAPKIAHIDLIDEELLARDRTHALIHLYIKPTENPNEAVSFLTERFTSEQIPFEISTVKVKEEDWATEWKKYYHPIKVGKRLVVCPSWEHYDLAEDEVMISLDPGMAFGTGTHDTTRLCMQLLEEHVTAQTTVLDMGCGSGILSIAAMLLGGKSAVGVDIDDTAVRVANENAAMNNVTEKTTFLCGDLTDKVSGTFDLICANIVADVIIRLSPVIPQFLKQDGVFIASGIIAERADEVVSALEAIGLHIVKRAESGGWVALDCKF
ncbi:ribosomal protein L11 methyltransferase [Hydrogenoanaerobacterium saccharovorans]|uniref:Ribosomal protein L11 methyltransferase n=1 Tax=Hydrogenoanaerobacterium saccharovorans TaxID=474960 RepID=A0A1H8CLY4_9FIRM|nr:50S ribosomal protein L11 methyltransferase [Hydrogenoanaerobacterium saccharovorans]RPF43171.1 ribosomal protein L11 methyltransferase [Hydrogenoanaerobacterium saccharovorans]SEM95444.1 ribosomal protein L11 methyltransferase [Hydrogenoanaerobacterium saccharovorans]